VLETVPQALPEQPGPETVQFTALFVVPVTVALNCCVAPVITVAVVGEMVTAIWLVIVTMAVPDLLGSACDVAVTTTFDGVGTLAGAVYRPDALIVPQPVPLQPAPERLHVTAVLVVPVTVAVNCCCAPMVTVAVAGETATVIAGVTVTTAFADLLGSAFDVAMTFTVAGVGTAAGAV
jgi:hypothetical protein